MSLKLGGRLFTGPFSVDTTEVRPNHVPVVYAIIAKGGPAWAPAFRVVDIGLSSDRGVRFADHPHRADWHIGADEALAVYLFYAPRSEFSEAERAGVAEDLRHKYDPPRGLV